MPRTARRFPPLRTATDNSEMRALAALATSLGFPGSPGPGYVLVSGCPVLGPDGRIFEGLTEMLRVFSEEGLRKAIAGER
jgi:hypothetical protein